MARFIEDLLAGIFSFVPEEKRYYRNKSMSEWYVFFHGLKDDYPVLQMIRFRDRGGVVDSRQLEQAHSNISGHLITSWGFDFDPFEIKTENCQRIFKRESANFTDDEIRQMQKVAEKYIERFGITVQESRFCR